MAVSSFLLGTGKIKLDIENEEARIILNNPPENRINPEFVADFNKALDLVLQSKARYLITTSIGKFFSNGLQTNDTRVGQDEFWLEFQRLLCRLIAFPILTIAMLNGHTFAGGAMIALAHDYRIMNNEKGWFSFNEIHLPSRLPEFVIKLIKIKTSGDYVIQELVNYGMRLTAERCLELGLINQHCKMFQLHDCSKQFAKQRLKLLNENSRWILHKMKLDMYKSLIDVHRQRLKLVDTQELESKL